MCELGLQAEQSQVKVRTTVLAEDLDERPDFLKMELHRGDTGVKVVRRGHLRQHVGRGLLFGDCSGLLHQKSGGVCDGQVQVRTSLVRGAIDIAVRWRAVEKDMMIFPLRPEWPIYFSEFLGSLKSVASTRPWAARGVLG